MTRTIDRRKLLAGTAAITAALVVPALPAISESRTLLAAQRLWQGDVVLISPNTGLVYRYQPGIMDWISGVAMANSRPGDEVFVWGNFARCGTA